MMISLKHPIEVYGVKQQELVLKRTPEESVTLELLHCLYKRYISSGFRGHVTFVDWLETCFADVVAVIVEYAFGLPEGAGLQLHVEDLEKVMPVVSGFFEKFTASPSIGQ